MGTGNSMSSIEGWVVTHPQNVDAQQLRATAPVYLPPLSQSQTEYSRLTDDVSIQDYAYDHQGELPQELLTNLDMCGDTSRDSTLSQIMAADEFMGVSIVMKPTGLFWYKHLIL